MKFVAIDVETANADISSICQIGIACFDNGKIVQEWSSYVDPEDYFDWMNTRIHGIDEAVVAGKPKISELETTLNQFLRNNITVCHTHFDRVALSRAFDKYGLNQIETSWLDSARVVRRTWEELSQSGYGLKNVCLKIGYEFKHHDALEDAKAAGHIVLAALEKSNLDGQSLADFRSAIYRPVDIRREGNPDGVLAGEVIVFTGALEIPRNEAADLAASVGCKVDSNVTKRTTILVVGDQDVSRLAGHKKSSKHRKAEELCANGQEIRIIRESDFKALTAQATC